MKTAITCARMKALDQNTIQNMGIPSLVLMERASLSFAEALKENHPHLQKTLVVCGSGNNGGDGFAIARLLHLSGIPTTIYFAGNPEHLTEETRQQKTIAENYKVPTVKNPNFSEYTTIVDAFLGIGLSREVTGKYEQLIQNINTSGAYIASVDIPSGLSGDTGKPLGCAVRADLTVTFAYPKWGQLLDPGRTYCGKLVVTDIGIYAPEYEPFPGDKTQSNPRAEQLKLPEISDLSVLLFRPASGNKGTFGKLLAVTGSKGMSGAAGLSAKAALTAGAGMVKIQTTEDNRIILQTLLPEAMLSTSDAEEDWRASLNWCDALLIGPGLGSSEESKTKVRWFLKEAKAAEKPVVLDADGLNLLAKNPDWYELLPPHTILTPHLGEFSRLTGKTILQIQENPITAAQEFVQTHPVTLVLKDARTITACQITNHPLFCRNTDETSYDPKRSGKEQAQASLYLNTSGNSGMATAGSGDVLAGILAGLVTSNHKNPWNEELIPIGVYLHGLAGDLAAEKKGKRSMLASDLIDGLCTAIQKIEKQEETVK